MTNSSLIRVILVAGGLGLVVPDAFSATNYFDIEDSLRIKRILERPQVTMDGSAVAYVVGDWQDDASILAHKPLGQLRVHTVTGGKSTIISRYASDPAWSRSGKALAYFEGLGVARELVVTGITTAEHTAARLKVAGPAPRYSGRYFAPIWSADDRFIVVAETRTQTRTTPAAAPYSVKSSDLQVPFDIDFQDNTRTRLVRIDTRASTRKTISPELALREIYPNPEGSRLVIAAAKSDQAGVFVGDTYVQPLLYQLVSVDDGKSRELSVDASASLLGWRDDATLLAQTQAGIVAIDVDTGGTGVVIEAARLPASPGFSVAGNMLAGWGPAATAERNGFVVPPPEPDRMIVGDTATGTTREILGSADNLEILAGAWLPGARLVLHARRLDTLAEQFLLWSGSEVQLLLETESSLGPLAAAADILAFSAETATRPPELFLLDINDSQLQRRSNLNARLADTAAVAPRLVEGKTRDEQRWRALLYLPTTGSERTGQALVVRSYARLTDQRHTFNAEAQMHVARGYAYLLPDVFPRRGALHSAYEQTLPAAIDTVRRDFGLKGRTGFVGGSLGGYAGLVLLTRSKAADAAVLRAAPAEFALSWATGKDRDADLLEYLMSGERPEQNPQAYRDDSPFYLANRITAPTLFLHGTDDEQVPFAQGQWMFQSLRRLGNVHAELRVYPGADHKIIRGSRQRYVDFYQQIFGWWERFLQPESS